VRQDIDCEFIGSKNSHYSAKVRACLQYKRISHSERTETIESMMRVKELTGDHAYPVVVCPDGTALPEDPLQPLIAGLIETVADEFMLSTTMGLRGYAKDTREWAKNMFIQISTERVTDKLIRERGATNGGRIANSIEHDGDYEA
jgi:hypothetical protein